MKMEEEKAIELAEEFTKMDFSNPMGWTGYYDSELNELSLAIKTVLNMLKEKDRAIEKLKKHNKELLRKLRNRVKEVKKLNKYNLYKKEFKTLNEQIKKKDEIIEKLEKEAQRHFETTIIQAKNFSRKLDIKDKTIDLMAEKMAFNFDINSEVDVYTYKRQIKQYYKSKAEKE